MVSFATTQMSSKGQVVIPQEVRERLGLKAGSRFVVVAEAGVVIFKTIEAPEMREFEGLVSAARRQAKKARMHKSDITEAIQRVRARA